MGNEEMDESMTETRWLHYPKLNLFTLNWEWHHWKHERNLLLLSIYTNLVARFTTINSLHNNQSRWVCSLVGKSLNFLYVSVAGCDRIVRISHDCDFIIIMNTKQRRKNKCCTQENRCVGVLDETSFCDISHTQT